MKLLILTLILFSFGAFAQSGDKYIQAVEDIEQIKLDYEDKLAKIEIDYALKILEIENMSDQDLLDFLKDYPQNKSDSLGLGSLKNNHISDAEALIKESFKLLNYQVKDNNNQTIKN